MALDNDSRASRFRPAWKLWQRNFSMICALFTVVALVVGSVFSAGQYYAQDLALRRDVAIIRSDINISQGILTKLTLDVSAIKGAMGLFSEQHAGSKDAGKRAELR